MVGCDVNARTTVSLSRAKTIVAKGNTNEKIGANRFDSNLNSSFLSWRDCYIHSHIDAGTGEQT